MPASRHLTLLSFNSVQWQWRLRRWQRNLRGLFRGNLQQAGVSVTGILIFTNLVLFTLMVAQGILAGQGPSAILNPDTYLLLHAGAQYWPLVLVEGEWWRCLTYAFAHGGIIHLGFNMVVLYQVGPLLEGEIGKARFIFLYTFTALTATALGYFWHPMAPVVGASGSLFGLIGFSVVYYHRLGPQGLHIRNFMFQWAIFAFVFGLLVGADNAGHLGGALGGAFLGLLIPVSWRRRSLLDQIFIGLAVFSTAAIFYSLAMLVLSWLSAGSR
ncbi:MAG TPA: rhomboid family intramembrane serine protease [Desulfuromonadales bacterium]